MANLVEEAKIQINSLLASAQKRACERGELPEADVLNGTVEIPKDTANGDFAANHAMTGAKALRMAPRKIADALVANLELYGSWFTSAEAAGPGFINFRLGSDWYGDVLAAASHWLSFLEKKAGDASAVKRFAVGYGPEAPLLWVGEHASSYAVGKGASRAAEAQRALEKLVGFASAASKAETVVEK